MWRVKITVVNYRSHCWNKKKSGMPWLQKKKKENHWLKGAVRQNCYNCIFLLKSVVFALYHINASRLDNACELSFLQTCACPAAVRG